MDSKQNWVEFIDELQNRISAALQEVDGKAKFIEDKWERPEGGGGNTGRDCRRREGKLSSQWRRKF